MSLIQTFVVEDCTDYQEMTSNAKQSRWTIPNEVVSAYSSDGWKYYASSYTNVKLNAPISTPSSIEFELIDYDVHWAEAPFYRIADSNGANLLPLLYQRSTNKFTFCGEDVSQNLVKGATYRIEVYSDSAKLYENNTLIKTVSRTNHNPFILYDGTGIQRYLQIRNFKVKPL